MNAKKSQRVREAVEGLYAQMTAAGVDTLLDDRDVRPGVMFADAELIGIPFRIVVGEKNLDKGLVEFRARTDDSSQNQPMDGIVDLLKELLAEAE